MKEDGQIYRIICTYHDITERKRAEEAIATAHRQLQSIIDNTTAIVYAFDLEERFILANAAVAELLNSTPERMIGKRRHEFMSRKDADWHESNDRQVIKAGRALDFEEYIELKDRSIIWLTTKFPLRNAQGRVYAVAGISADITERKRAEETLKKAHDTLENKVKERTSELEKAYNSLKESEQSLAEAQRMAHLGNWYRSFITDKIYWSDEAYRIFGFEPQEFEVSFSVFLTYIHPEDRDYVKNSIKKALNGDPYEIDFRIISADQKEHIVHS